MAEQAAGSEATESAGGANGKMTLLEAYVSCLLHDVKKILLNTDRDSSHYATWGPDHYRLDKLSTQVGNQRLSPPERVQLHSDPKRDCAIHRLIKLHHNDPKPDKKPPGWEPVDRRGLDPVAIYAIQAADRVHKKLYFPGELRTGDPRPKPEIGTVEQERFPCHYPFWGQPKFWHPHDVPHLGQPVGYEPEVIWADSTERFCELAQQLTELSESETGLTPRAVLALLAEKCSDFPESTYFPVLSLNFHLRLAGALFLLFHKQMRDLTIPQASPLPATLSVCLTTLTTPPERLRNRLRDVANIRKISHRLLEHVHEVLRRAYLPEELADLFRHPDSSPFLFYTKDALVLLHAENEWTALRQACRTVAEECSTDIGLQCLAATIPVDLHLSGNAQELAPYAGCRLSVLPPEMTKAGIHVDEPQLGAGHNETAACPRSFAEEELNACFTCGVPLPESRGQTDGDDTLCLKCARLRKEYLFCPVCRHYTVNQWCPFCPSKTQLLPSPSLLAGEEDRAAYVMIATNCRPEVPSVRGEEVTAIRAEAEVNLARYREHRLWFDLNRSRRSKPTPGMLNAFAEIRTTRFGLYEYLQASLDMARFQEALERELRSCLPPGEQPESYVLYRSPSLTVLLLPASRLPQFWAGLQPLLGRLLLSWAAKVVACDVNVPVWSIVREFLQEVKFLNGSERVARELRQMARDWYSAPRDSKRPDAFGKGRELLRQSALDEQAVHAAHSGLVVFRGQARRGFDWETGDYLIKVGGDLPQGPRVRAPLSQLNAVADLAADVCAEGAHQRAAAEMVALELDSRTYGRERVDRDLARRLKRRVALLADVDEIPGLIREVASQLGEEDRRREARKSRPWSKSRR
jgi:hypothetical protein